MIEGPDEALIRGFAHELVSAAKKDAPPATA